MVLRSTELKRPSRPHLNILGTRGIPAAYGGFESFAERLALWLTKRGWSVTVYCQADSDVADHVDNWRGIERVHLSTNLGGAAGTIAYDLKATRHVLKQPGIDLVLGYNTALFCLLQRIKRRKVFMNMDGIEWKRSKWGPLAKAWFALNELIGVNLATTAIADHPAIAKHLRSRSFKQIKTLAYGADSVTHAPITPIDALGLKQNQYFISIARIEPENSILSLIQAYQKSKVSQKLVILGKLDPKIRYHAKILSFKSPHIILPGPIYDDITVKSLRFHCRAYLHGHQVGGTNPSLVEALGAGNAVIAHDNQFNRETTDNSQYYFRSVSCCSAHFQKLAIDDFAVEKARRAARLRHSDAYQWIDILTQYEALLGESEAISPAMEKAS